MGTQHLAQQKHSVKAGCGFSSSHKLGALWGSPHQNLSPDTLSRWLQRTKAPGGSESPQNRATNSQKVHDPIALGPPGRAHRPLQSLPHSCLAHMQVLEEKFNLLLDARRGGDHRFLVKGAMCLSAYKGNLGLLSALKSPRGPGILESYP